MKLKKLEKTREKWRELERSGEKLREIESSGDIEYMNSKPAVIEAYEKRLGLWEGRKKCFLNCKKFSIDR
ncbi:MAG: hypothetical protein LBE13_21030 [Bacteroidales bacterium]|nr:hypothetical protein [Bacteroidales bacterium]